MVAYVIGIISALFFFNIDPCKTEAVKTRKAKDVDGDENKVCVMFWKLNKMTMTAT